MKKRILAIAFVMLMFPMALILTACGGGTLKTGVNYAVAEVSVSWASDEEKTAFLAETEMTEQELIAGTLAQQQGSVVVFNEDGSITLTMSEDADPMTMYYVVEGNTLKVYRDEAKEQQTGEMKIVGDTLVQEQQLEMGLNSKIKMVYKVK